MDRVCSVIRVVDDGWFRHVGSPTAVRQPIKVGMCTRRLEWQLRSAQTEMQSMWDHCQSLGLGLRREAGVRRSAQPAMGALG